MRNQLNVFVLVSVIGVTIGFAEEDSTAEKDSQTSANEFREEQKQECMDYLKKQQKRNKEFRDILKYMNPKDKYVPIRKHRETQFKEDQAFQEKQHEENMAFLKEYLANSKKLTDARKDQLIDFYEQQYDEAVKFRETQHDENTTFFEEIALTRGEIRNYWFEQNIGISTGLKKRRPCFQGQK